MNRKQNILRNISTLTKFEPMSPKKIHYVNCLTKHNIMTELIELVAQKNQFVIETKYDNVYGVPQLIQILFAHKLKLHIVLVETLYLPKSDSYLHNQIASLFSIILSPSNKIQSWNDIKTKLKLFLDFSIFKLDQIEKIDVVNIQHKFQEWFRKNFANIQLQHAPSDNWSLEDAIAFSFQQYFNQYLSCSYQWNVGLFARFDTNCNEKLIKDRLVLNLLSDNRRRHNLTQYAVHECMAVNKIAAFLQNYWTRKHQENYLKKYYNNC